MKKDFEKYIEEVDSLMNENKFIEAILALKKIIKKFPNNAYGYYLLGVARLKTGLFSLAEKSFLEADRLDPNHPEVIRSLGWTKIMLGKTEEGRKDLRNAVNLNLMDYKAYLDLGSSYISEFDFEEGLAWINRAKSLSLGSEFVKKNYEVAQETKKSFLNLSKKEQEKIKKEKNNPETRKQMRLAALEKNFGREEGIKGDIANELMDELEMSGLDDKMFVYPDMAKSVKKETKESIAKKRKEIEKNLLALIKKYKANITIDEIKEIIYNEKSHKELDEIVKKLDQNQSPEEFERMLYLINDVWNYFPHKVLGGISPAEKILNPNI